MPTEKTIILPTIGEITLVHRRGLRRVSLRILPSGAVRLNCPYGIAAEKAIAFAVSKTKWILSARKRVLESNAQLPSFSDADIATLRQQAKEQLPKRVVCYAQRFGFTVNKVTIRATRSKWGSCTTGNNISLSLFLMALPEHLQDFVIIHELCHTVHHNHSDAFHQLVNRCTDGKEQQLQCELRHYSVR